MTTLALTDDELFIVTNYKELPRQQRRLVKAILTQLIEGHYAAEREKEMAKEMRVAA